MSEPKYKAIENDLRAAIENGTYKEGDLIPKEMELVAQYAVSRPTVRQAIANLVNDGLLQKKQHVGTVVRANKIGQEFTHVIESYDKEMRAKGLTTSTQVLAYQDEPATAEVAEKLGLHEGDQVYKLIRLRFAGEQPIVLVTSYLPYAVLPGFGSIDFNHTSLYNELNKAGKPVTHVQRKLEVVSGDETTSALLNVPTGAPLFYFRTQGSCPDGEIVEYSQAKYRGDSNYFIFDLDKSANDNELRL